MRSVYQCVIDENLHACRETMSDNLYVRVESEDDQSNGPGTPKKSTSLSSLRNLRESFKRSDSASSQVSLANNGSATTIEEEQPKKPG